MSGSLLKTPVERGITMRRLLARLFLSGILFLSGFSDSLSDVWPDSFYQMFGRLVSGRCFAGLPETVFREILLSPAVSLLLLIL